MVQWHRNGHLEGENKQPVETPVLTAAGFHYPSSHVAFLLLDFSLGYLNFMSQIETSQKLPASL
ncbi:hypothetical protein VCRA2133E348_590049 [Vibrio crassostreae]|nr:hypothetical protein VCRA2119O48_890005 [Vibrio crassostreae]CAK3048206.1 hypothetical protein VCRA2133E348_590049 [Vibrio crassostreae]CAK3583262.1 hypothetical protein VCRA213O314_640005 [Vibrio crassostreae]CAK3985974.1 hypothetical protein VCRA212O16_550047 [Vibrio crassostreae]